MSMPDFSNADLARLGLSLQLRKLSESLRLAVAAEDTGRTSGTDGTASGDDLVGRLWSLLATDYPALQEALVSYQQSRGSSWQEVAQLSGLSTEQARQRWAQAGAQHLADPAAEAKALDDWYVLHAQLEPLARVRDPFSRLLSGRPAGERECLICAKYAGLPVPAWAGFAVPPGGHLFDDGRWRVGHGPTPYWPAGTLLIESHRHFLDYADFDADEASTIGPLIQRFTEPLKEATGASRVHIFSCMEGTEHFHLWMVPRVEGQTSGRTFIANPGYCTPADAEEVIDRVRKSMEAAADR
jgi:diadenosine tetraphosphate (Ap4A) HIT family hydrolase